MSVTTSPHAAAATWIERTWRVTLDTPYSLAPGALYTGSIHREVLGLDAQGNVVAKPDDQPQAITVRFADIQNETVMVSGVTLTVAQITAFLAAYCDQKASAQGE